MNRPLPRLGIFALLVCLNGSSLGQAAQKSLPVDAKMALSLLPQAPPGLEKLGPWKLTVSRARQETDVDWMTTTVERSYEQAEPAPGESPASVSIRALDSGRYEVPLQMFGVDPLTNPRRDFEVQKYPAFKRQTGTGSERVVILVNGRWLVDVTLQGLEPAQLQQFYASLPLSQLAAVRETPAANLPSELQLQYVDELNPESNSQRQSFFLTQAQKIAAEKEAAASRDEPFVDYYKNRDRGEPKR